MGLDHAKWVLGVLITGFPDVKHTIEDVIVKDDRVVIRWTATGTQTGEFQGIAPTGKQATWTGVNIYRFECGKIAEQWSELDGIGRLQQLGVMATPTPSRPTSGKPDQALTPLSPMGERRGHAGSGRNWMLRVAVIASLLIIAIASGLTQNAPEFAPLRRQHRLPGARRRRRRRTSPLPAASSRTPWAVTMPTC